MSEFRVREALASQADDLLCSLKVQVDAFAVCEVGEGQAVTVPPIAEIVVHYVLCGSGSIDWAGGSVAIEEGTVVIVPRNLAKRLAGAGSTLTVVDAPQGCTMSNGLQRYVTSDTRGEVLRLACAKVSAELGQGLGLFDALDRPRVEYPDSSSRMLFEVILDELADPAVGMKSMIEASMKQILVRVLRSMLEKPESGAALSATLHDEKLGAVVKAIVSNPGGCHSLPTLARLAGMTPVCLSQRFNEVFGRSPLALVQSARMDAAKDMLLTTGLPVKSIAASVGYASRSHFSREFSKLIGRDPTAFRQSARSK